MFSEGISHEQDKENRFKILLDEYKLIEAAR